MDKHEIQDVSPGFGTLNTVGWEHTYNNVKLCDGTPARTEVRLRKRWYTYHILVNDFGFSVPGTATITGVKVEILSKAEYVNALVTQIICLTKDCDGIDSSENGGDADGDYYWGTSYGYHFTGGGSGYDWNYGLTPSEVNSDCFGVLFSIENKDNNTPTHAYVDCVKVTIYYTDGGSGSDTGPHLPGHAEQMLF